MPMSLQGQLTFEEGIGCLAPVAESPAQVPSPAWIAGCILDGVRDLDQMSLVHGARF